MRIESKLCHLTEDKAVVQVNGWINEKNLGSALAQGPTVEIAEDKAISRLNKRLKANTKDQVTITSIDNVKRQTRSEVELPISNKNEDNKLNQEPSDWSNELAEIDFEIKRLKWSREDEIIFLEKTFGYNSRSKITNYSEILKYLSLLKKTDNLDESKRLNANIINLIAESDLILKDLCWDHIQGREYLQKEFNVSTRKELNEKQLITFINNLKCIQNQ